MWIHVIIREEIKENLEIDYVKAMGAYVSKSLAEEEARRLSGIYRGSGFHVDTVFFDDRKDRK